MNENRNEEDLLRSATLQNARSIFRARQRAEEELVRAKETLARQSEWLRVTLASIGDAVVTADIEGRILSLNSVAESLTGWTEQEARGRPLSEVFRIFHEETRAPVENPAERVLQEGRIIGLANHTVLVARDGTETPIDDSAAPIRDEQGSVRGVVLIFRSVAEHRRAERALQKSERELSDFFENASVGLHWVGPDGVVLRVNRAELNMLGYSREEYVGRNIAEFHVDQDIIADILRRLAAGETLRDREARMRCKDGSIKHVLIDSSVMWEDGRFVHTRCFTRDITDRKERERVQARLAAIVDSSDDAIISKDLDGIITSWNRGAERLFGYTAHEAIGQSITLIIPPERLNEEPGILERLRRGERVDHFETVRVRKDGAALDISLTISPLKDAQGRIIGASKIARDITEPKRAEQTLGERAEQLRMALEAGRMGTWEWNIATGKVAWSAGLEAIHGLSRGTFAGTFDAFQKDIHPEDRERVLGSISRTAEQGDDHQVEYRIVLPGGEVRWVEGRGRLFRDQTGDAIRMMGVCSDITARKQAEERERALTERTLAATAKFRAVFNQSGIFAGIMDLAGNLREVNDLAVAWCGYTKDQVIDRPFWETPWWRGAPEIQARIRAATAQAAAGEVFREELRYRVADGSERIVDFAMHPIRNEAGVVRFLHPTGIDITERKRTEEALRESEQRFRLMAETVPSIIWTAAPDGTITYVNERWLEYTGLTSEENAGGWTERVLHPEDYDRCVEAWNTALQEGSSYEVEVRNRRHDGVYRWFVTRAVPLRDAAGRIVQWFGTTTDIDDRKRVEQTSRFLADAGKTLAELTDYESTLQRVAGLAVPAFADWCAVDMLQADGLVRRLAVTHAEPSKVKLAQELSQRYPPKPSDSHGVMKVLRTGAPEWLPTIPDSLLVDQAQDEDHLRIIRQLGLKSVISTPLCSRGRTIGALTFVTAESGRVFDTTDLAAAEDLAHRAVIAIENANLIGTLKETDRRKDEFLAMLAHELRNPLAPIRNAAHIFKATASPTSELRWATEVIDRQIHQMTRLIDDLLDVSRISRGKIELRKERVELAEVVNSAVEASRPLVEKWGHQLTVDLPSEPLILDADTTRLAQVLLNLLNNAAKYTDQGGRISLQAQRQDGHVLIRVKDTGIGIPAHMLSRIFDMFTQVEHSLERSEGGLGIGLTLVHRLVEMHGGTIEARSEGKGQGSEFIVRLPIAADTGQAAAAEAQKATAAAPCRILVVDDNLDSADSLAILLRILGNEVHTAHDGLEAVGAAAAFQPDVVLLDIGLPKLNGYEAARRIRQHKAGAQMLIIALTGWGQEEDRRRSQEAGFDHHMTKPVDLTVLQKLLAQRARTKKGNA